MQHNDIGPCGHDTFQDVSAGGMGGAITPGVCGMRACAVRPGGEEALQYSKARHSHQWSDGISLSCMNSTVYNNTIVDATDGGIVIFGAPWSVVRENHISVKTRTMLGGINRESPYTLQSWQELTCSGRHAPVEAGGELLWHQSAWEPHRGRVCDCCESPPVLVHHNLLLLDLLLMRGVWEGLDG